MQEVGEANVESLLFYWVTLSFVGVWGHCQVFVGAWAKGKGQKGAGHLVVSEP